SASLGLRNEKPEAARMTTIVAATEARLYTNLGDCRLFNQRLRFRQFGAPSVAVRIALSSSAGDSTGSRAYKLPSVRATAATRGAHRSHVFTWWLKAVCSAGCNSPSR